MSLVAGMDVGGTNLRVGVIDGLNLVYEERIRADFNGICSESPPDVALSRIIDVIGSLLNRTLEQFPGIIAIGMGFPGFINPNEGPQRGYIVQSPNLPGLKNVNLAGRLTQMINRPVFIQNDALAAAYGEFRLNGTHRNNLIYIGLGTGVGGGLILAGHPVEGEHGVAMEIGHLIVEAGGRACGCGNLGCLEQYASASGVGISYAQSSSTMGMDASQVAALANTGDQWALAAYALAGDKLGQALAHILKVVDVSQVVVGGGLSLSWALMQQAFDKRLQADLVPVLRNKISIQISTNEDKAGIIGAALLAIPE